MIFYSTLSSVYKVGLMTTFKILAAILSTGALIYFGWFLFLILAKPYSIWRMNYRQYHTNIYGQQTTFSGHVHEKLIYLKYITFFIMEIVALYQLSMICLHWMPNDWMRRTEDGEWITMQSSISGVISFYGALILSSIIAKGIKARVANDQHKIDLMLIERIDDARDLASLIRIKDEFSKAYDQGAHSISKGYTDIYKKIADIAPDRFAERSAFAKAMENIDKRLEFLQQNGVSEAH
tara:strand:- start:30 stop:740 length:711 start_codon:yes stop_codon:yes gene_type:complete